MRRFRTGTGIYIIVPMFLLLTAGAYILVMLKRSTLAANIINLTFEGLLVLLYLFYFCTGLTIKDQKVTFRAPLRRKTMDLTAIALVRQAVFMTKFITDEGTFYVLTTKKTKGILESVFKDL